jgi:hypothetical protein
MSDLDWAFFYHNYDECLRHACIATRFRFSHELTPGNQKIMAYIDAVRITQSLRDASYYGGVTFGIVSTIPLVSVLGAMSLIQKQSVVHPVRVLAGVTVLGAYMWNWNRICDIGSHIYMLRKLPLAFNCFLALPPDTRVYKDTVQLIERLKQTNRL